MAEDSFLFPASFSQQRLWFLDQIMPGTAVYNMSTVTRYPFAINTDIFKKCINEIVRRHESLRTTFKALNGQPFQLVAGSLIVDMPVYDLSGLAREDQERELLRLAQRNAMELFDLRKGPLIRAVLVKKENTDHVFLLAMHHIISDAWSINLFFNELELLYDAFVLGKPSPLTELAIQYADYSVWQRDYLTGTVLEKEMDYWRKVLEDAEPLQLPADYSRPALQSFRGMQHHFSVPPRLAGEIRLLSQQHNATLFMTLFASFAVLLHHYCRQQDIMIGVPVAGRNQTELEQLIGFFVNAVVIRTNLSPIDNFVHLLQQVRSRSLGAFAHAELPFEKLVEELHPDRDLSRNPLFQVLFQMTARKEGAAGNPAADAVDLNAEAHISKFDLTLSMGEEGDELKGYFECNTDLFAPHTIQRMAGHFLNLLQNITDDPLKPLHQLQIIGAEERKILLQDFNRSTRDYPSHPFVHELISEQARQHPEAIALFTDEHEFSYKWLESLSNRFANALIGRGIGPEHLVAVALPRSAQMVALHLAILKAGAAFVPLDTAYPVERLQFMLTDLSATLLVTDAHFIGRLSLTDPTVLLLHQLMDEAVSYPDQLSPVPLLAQHRCYIMYTSGSTGKPKGVELHHGGLLNLVRWNIDAYGLTREDRNLQMATPAYDAYVYEVFPALSAGASLYLAGDIARTSAEELTNKIAEHGLTVCCVPTALGEAILQDVQRPPSLRLIGTAGDRLSQLPKVSLPFVFLNLYGPTENTVIASYTRVNFDEPVVPPIGKPVANVKLYALNDFLNPVPVGVTGELYLGGAGVGRGYLRMPRLTAERFIPDPFAGVEGARLYRTGDLVRWRSDGNLEFIGRTDRQVKLRGFRIELEEVECVLLKHQLVREAAVLLQKAAGGSGNVLVALVALEKDVMLDPQELRDWIRSQLPPFMVPGQLSVLPQLPKSFSGKIDREALQKQISAPGSFDTYDTGANTPLEKSIAAMLSELLPGSRISVERNFFDMGAHSLMMAQVQHRLQQMLRRDVPLVDLFQYPTIRSLSRHLLASSEDSQAKEEQPLMEFTGNTK